MSTPHSSLHWPPFISRIKSKFRRLPFQTLGNFCLSVSYPLQCSLYSAIVLLLNNNNNLWRSYCVVGMGKSYICHFL